MSRREQIEALARAWRALGDGRTTKEFWSIPKSVAVPDPLSIWFFHGRSRLTDLYIGGTDTGDATPCLALLRDVYGEDVDMSHEYDGSTEIWVPRRVSIPEYELTPSPSIVSRIDAVRLALAQEQRL